MTHEEAIKQLSNVTIYHQGECTREALDMAIEALEKQIPKRPKYEADKSDPGELSYDTWYCPKCSEIFSVKYDRHNFCPECGQAIDWGVSE